MQSEQPQTQYIPITTLTGFNTWNETALLQIPYEDICITSCSHADKRHLTLYTNFFVRCQNCP
jgi:hypothetical protein